MKRFRVLFLIFFIGISFFAIAQNPDDALVELANEMYGFGDKKDALGVYLQAVEMNPDNVKANFMAGKCYLETIQKELSVSYLQKAYKIDKNIAPDILFLIANGYQLGGKFDDAIESYKKYKQEMNESKAYAMKSSVKDEIIRTDRKIFECQNAAVYYTNKKEYEINNINDVINSEYPDYAPGVNADNDFIIFTSRRSGGVGKNKDVDNEYFEDIWYSKKINGVWSSPKNLGKPINSETHDASIGLSPDGKEMFLYKPDNGGDIYTSRLDDNGVWSAPENMGKIVNSRFNEPSVSISSDGKVLYFSSDRPGGFGGLDIYKAELDEKGNWSRAVNLGSTINTEYDDDSPFIDYDGKTLYFSSRGHKGMGGYDIYKSFYDNTKKLWAQPENMGYPVNSPDDDIYFVITKNGKTGYYASAKGDGYGDKDIYIINLEKVTLEVKKDSVKLEPKPIKKDSVVAQKVEQKPQVDTTSKPQTVAKIEQKPVQQQVEREKKALPEVKREPEKKAEPEKAEIQKPKDSPPPVAKKVENIPTTIKGNILDSDTDEPIEAKIVLNDMKGNVMNVIDVGPDGKFEMEISQSKASKVSLTVTKSGYIYNNVTISIPANSKSTKPIVKEFHLRKINVGAVFILRNIYYDFDKAVIKKESFQYLDKLVAWLKSHPTVSLEISGHTDNSGLDSYNKILSQKRVDAVMLYLTAKGIGAERLTAIGYGEERPLASNDDNKEGREINRRTEFKVLSK